MNDREEFVKNLYTQDLYITNNPSLHEEDSPWKISKILPLVDRFSSAAQNSMPLTLLDCGGGKGLILAAVANHLTQRHGRPVNKYALDLSPGMLQIQKQQNPDLRKLLQEDICQTSLAPKEVDLTLLIDVIEHVKNPAGALAEIQRISKFAIFKVPLEDNWFPRGWNWLRRGKPRREAAAGIGHINFYSFGTLRKQIEKHGGAILHHDFANVFEYYRTAPHYQGYGGHYFKWNRILGERTYRWSPALSSGLLFEDCALVLVKCDGGSSPHQP